jgi:hypothetical protein
VNLRRRATPHHRMRHALVLRSEMGQSGPNADVRVESDLAPIADVGRAPRHVAEVPGSDICTAAILCLFDHLVGEREQVVGDLEAERLRGLEVDHRLEPGRLPHRQVGRPSALENLRGVDAVLAIEVW